VLLGLAVIVGLADSDTDEESRAAPVGVRAIKRGSSEMDSPLGLMNLEGKLDSIAVVVTRTIRIDKGK
jgi:hypothetical protein